MLLLVSSSVLPRSSAGNAHPTKLRGARGERRATWRLGMVPSRGLLSFHRQAALFLCMAARAHARGDAKAFDRLFAAAAIGSLSRQTDNRQTARITHGLSPRSRSRACSTTKAGERVRAARAARLACVCVEWAYLISILTYTNRLRSTQEYVYALEEVHSLTERLELPLKRGECSCSSTGRGLDAPF